jgi:hypothetical protein
MKKKLCFVLTILLMVSLFASGNRDEKQTSEIKMENNQNTNLAPNINSDDSSYDDPRTLEFCFKDDKGRCLCLYHNIRKQKEIDFEDYEVFKDWSTETNIRKWVKQEIDGLSVIWNYMNGAILIMETESSNWFTGRGIRVGDPISKAYDAYVSDATLYKWDSVAKKSVKISSNPNCLYFLRQSDEGIIVYIANLIDEEMMNIRFSQKDGIITKIEIFFSN